MNPNVSGRKCDAEQHNAYSTNDIIFKTTATKTN